jgi:hypothetical protein
MTVCTDASSHHEPRDTGLVHGREAFAHQDLHNRRLGLGSEVGSILVGQGLCAFFGLREDGCLEACKTKIEGGSVLERARKRETPGLSTRSPLRNLRPSWVAQAQNLGRLIEGLAGGVVNGLAQQGIVSQRPHGHDLGVTARDQQGQKWEAGLAHVCREQGRDQVPLEVMDPHDRSV